MSKTASLGFAPSATLFSRLLSVIDRRADGQRPHRRPQRRPALFRLCTDGCGRSSWRARPRCDHSFRTRTPVFRGLFRLRVLAANAQRRGPLRHIGRSPANNDLRSGISHTNMRRPVAPEAKTKACQGGIMTATTQTTAAPIAEGKYFRWLQLAMGIVCMAMIANLQYGWTLFVDPIDAEVSLGPGCDPAGLHAFRGDGDLARSGRGVVRRQIRPTRRDRVRRGDDRHRLGDELLCRTRWCCSIPPRSSPESAPARSTAPASATR